MSEWAGPSIQLCLYIPGGPSSRLKGFADLPADLPADCLMGRIFEYLPGAKKILSQKKCAERELAGRGGGTFLQHASDHSKTLKSFVLNITLGSSSVRKSYK